MELKDFIEKSEAAKKKHKKFKLKQAENNLIDLEVRNKALNVVHEYITAAYPELLVRYSLKYHDPNPRYNCLFIIADKKLYSNPFHPLGVKYNPVMYVKLGLGMDAQCKNFEDIKYVCGFYDLRQRKESYLKEKPLSEYDLIYDQATRSNYIIFNGLTELLEFLAEELSIYSEIKKDEA